MRVEFEYEICPNVFIDVSANLVNGNIDEIETTIDGEYTDVSRLCAYPFAAIKPVPVEDLIRAAVYTAYAEVGEL